MQDLDLAFQSPDRHATEPHRDVARLIIILSVFAAGALIFFALRNFHVTDDPVWIGTVLLGFVALLILNLVLYMRWRHLPVLRWSFVSLITTLLVFIVVNGLEQGTGILWLYVFPPMVFYVTSPRAGAVLCLFGLTVMAFLLSPLGPALTPVHEYSPTFTIVFLFSMGFVMVFSYVLDRSRRRHAERLKQMAEMFEYAAKHDALTGLYNRREGTHRLNAEHARFERTEQPFSVILLDIDHFKRINDTLGHDTGDQVIRTVAERLVTGCRQMDVIARWGGEEFLLILPEANLEDARRTAERVRRLISDQPIHADKRPLEVSCSFGVAEIETDEPTQALLQRVDERLYEAKTSGRNRISCGRPPHTVSVSTSNE